MVNTLIISSLSERYYYDAFVRECNKLGVRVGILDPENFTRENQHMVIHLHNENQTGTIEVVELGDDSNSTITVNICDVKVAWYLRVNRAVRISEINETANRFKWSETLSALNSVLHILPCKWINTFESIERLNSNKLLQQLYAVKADLKTPDTIMSNCAKTVSNFCEKHGGRVLIKSIGNTNLDADGRMVLYSEIFKTDELSCSSDAIRACPVYAQEYIPKRYEYRVMVIGDEVLACRIDSQASKKTSIDWRYYDFDNVAHVSVKLPTEISAKLLAFMRSVNLGYGAIDMIETPHGDFVFLEVNPSGQWDWISKLAGLPIAGSVARLVKRYTT